MSKIVFWSPIHGQGQTSNIHVIAFLMELIYRKRILMMQTHFSKNNFESPLIGETICNQNNDQEFINVGLGMAVTFSGMNALDKERLECCCYSFENNEVLLLPGIEVYNRETFNRDIGSAIRSVIQDIDRQVDIVFIDANSGDDKLSIDLIDNADLTIINLTQRQFVLQRFFEDYGEKFRNNHKIFYLFGDYDNNSCFNIHNIRQKYKDTLSRKNSGVIPYCTGYLDAQNKGDIVKFINNGINRYHNRKSVEHSRKIGRIFLFHKNETNYFFHHCIRAVNRIYQMLPLNNGNKKEGASDCKSMI